MISLMGGRLSVAEETRHDVRSWTQVTGIGSGGTSGISTTS